jgi:5-methylcytosine-specific restriction endonuclease McrA
MRPLILQRDSHACVVCGTMSDRLEVHHIDNWPMNNAASNLVTLCSGHHRQWHAAMDTKPPRMLWPWLIDYAKRPLSTISKSKEATPSLPTESSSIIA